MIYFASAILAMFITIALIPVFKSLALKMNAAIDMPDERKTHHSPMARIGGLSMALGILVPVTLWCPLNDFTRAVMWGGGIIVVFGVIDDCLNLNFKIKFSAQAAAALLVIYFGHLRITHLGLLLPENYLLPEFIAIPLTLVSIVGVTNAVNLSDGLDGLAGGISLLSYICLGFLAYQAGYAAIAIISMAMAGAILGFLRFNTYPASIFMGDAGSQLLGFMLIVLSLSLTQANQPLSPVLPLLLIALPVLDTCMVMYERVMAGRPVFKPDHNHIHHKFMQLGFFHTEAVFIIYVLQSIFVTIAFVFRYHSEWLLLGIFFVAGGFLISLFALAHKVNWQRRRYDFLDKIVKANLREFKNHVLIKVSGRIITIGIPLLMVFSSFFPRELPGYMTTFACIWGVIIAAVLYWKKDMVGMIIRLILFMTIPYIIYFSEVKPAAWVTEELLVILHLFYGILALFTVLTLKYTRRAKGFKISPMDFLILFIAFVLPNLPDAQIQNFHFGVIAAKVIVLFFGYEVVIGELRENMKWLSISTITLLAVIFVRGFL
jgi:UDP-GlcNAc:undecaprenyl-phosphate GlcNAc-1-phosphate transferase